MARKRKRKKPKVKRGIEDSRFANRGNRQKFPNKKLSWKPVEKPGDSIMPVCSRCNQRPVSDARKTECGRCSVSYRGQSSSINTDIREVERLFCGF